MTSQTTKDDACRVLKQITADHANEDYFKKAEIVTHDVGWGVDLWVDGQKWRARRDRTPMPPRIDRVPICVVMVG